MHIYTSIMIMPIMIGVSGGRQSLYTSRPWGLKPLNINCTKHVWKVSSTRYPNHIICLKLYWHIWRRPKLLCNGLYTSYTVMCPQWSTLTITQPNYPPLSPTKPLESVHLWLLTQVKLPVASHILSYISGLPNVSCSHPHGQLISA